MSFVSFFERGALQSRGNASHWFRYLRKIIKDGRIIIPPEDIKKLLESDNLTIFQKITLERTSIIGTPTYIYANSLNKPAKRFFSDSLRGEINE